MSYFIKYLGTLLSIWLMGVNIAIMASLPTGFFLAITHLTYNAAMRILSP